MTASASAGKKRHPEACSAVLVLLTLSKQRLHLDPNLEKSDSPRTEQQRSLRELKIRGQGYETMYKQIVGKWLGLDVKISGLWMET